AQALLAYLALKDSRSEARETLIDLLWPDRFKAQAQASLRQVLFELRAIPGVGSGLLVATRERIALGPAIAGCDAWDFEAAADGTSLDDARLLLQLYGAGLLAGTTFGPDSIEQWLAIQRTRLEGRLESAVLRACGGDRLDPADHDRAVDALARLAETSPMCAAAVARLMEIEAARGRPDAAIRHYDRYADQLRSAFDEEPPAELAAARRELAAAPRSPPLVAATEKRSVFAQRDPWARSRADAPVVAVLPFRWQGRGDDGADDASALTEDITLMLSRCRWFSVLSRGATTPFAAEPIFIPREFARRTGADYLVYGALAERADRLRLTIELAEAETGCIVWTVCYDGENEDRRRWSAQICPLIVAALDPALAESEAAAAARSAIATTGSELAYRQLVLGYRHYYAGEWATAKDAFRAAIEADPRYAHAHAMLAVSIYMAGQLRRDADWSTNLNDAEAAARRALEIDSSEARACNILGQVLDWQGRHDEAPAFLDRSMALNPSFALSSTGHSYHALMTGAYDAAKSYLLTAMRLRVGDAGLGLCLPSKALADLHLGNAREALRTAHWAARLRPRFWLVRQTLAACLAANDDMPAAGAVVSDLRRDFPGLAAEEFVAWMPYAGRAQAALVADHLKRAGWR
ncbi:MAG: BTAD domain-containing putative transcriptional regulator, partial [Alphaproteobacteria bacterium]